MSYDVNRKYPRNNPSSKQLLVSHMNIMSNEGMNDFSYPDIANVYLILPKNQKDRT